MNRKPTIIDVAKRAGVSKSTVSLVLRNAPSVRAETRETVLSAMSALNYVRNRAAATLRGSETGLIGLVINDLRNPFFTEFATSAQMALSKRGFATVIANADEDPGLQRQVVRSILEHDVAALMISPSYGASADLVELIERHGTPTLQVLRKIDCAPDAFPFFSVDYARGGRAAAAHFWDQGFREVAFVGGLDGVQITEERIAGYREHCARFGRAPTVFHGHPTRAFGRRIAETIRAEHPHLQAAVCFNDRVALGMASSYAQAGLEVGRDFFVVGFDDIEECAQAHPQISSVHCDIGAFGEAAARALLDWLETGEPPRCLPRAPTRLIVRQSSAPIERRPTC